MIRDFGQWSSDHTELGALDELADINLAIDAVEFLTTRILDPPENNERRELREPLLPALGGLPFVMEKELDIDLHHFSKRNITPVFIFPGLEPRTRDRETIIADAERGTQTNEEAWKLYDKHEPENAVDKFGQSTSVTAYNLLRYMQSILFKRGVRFQVAPQSASAQLAYLARHMSNEIHAIHGSSELLLYDVENVILSLDFVQGQFEFINKHKLLQELGIMNPDILQDACLLAGTSLTATFPPLEANKRAPNKFRAALDLMNSKRVSGILLCGMFDHDAQTQRSRYVEKFRKSKFALRHPIVLKQDGIVEPLDLGNDPKDWDQFLTRRLPVELYGYLAKGVISTRVLNWLAHSEILELPPLDGGSSQVYRQFVKTQLSPIRESSLGVIASPLHRWFINHPIDLRYWFETFNEEKPTQITIKGILDGQPDITSWHVEQSVIDASSIEYKSSNNLSSNVLACTIRTLSQPDIAAKTIKSKSKDASDGKFYLNTKQELTYNAVWRFLQLRGYVDKEHRLTSWGETLNAVLQHLEERPDLEEAGFLAIELARLDLLTPKDLFPEYSGGPTNGKEHEKDYVRLISRVASLGRLQHDTAGFTGPLSKDLLGYNSVIAELRASLRDLVEVSLTTLFLGGSAQREREDLTELGLTLPFLLPNDCALGIAVKSYLNELLYYDEPDSADTKARTKTTAAHSWFPNSTNLVGDLKTAFLLWDAVYMGVKSSPLSEKTRRTWDDIHSWLDAKR